MTSSGGPYAGGEKIDVVKGKSERGEVIHLTKGPTGRQALHPRDQVKGAYLGQTIVKIRKNPMCSRTLTNRGGSKKGQEKGKVKEVHQQAQSVKWASTL